MSKTVTHSERFWRWLLALSERKIKGCVGGLQLYCPNCYRWSSIVGIENIEGRVRNDVHYERYRCGGCHSIHWWKMYGLLAYSIPDCEVPQ